MPVRRNAGSANRRIRLGIWGLGRGSHFNSLCASVGIDVVVGCDLVPHLRQRFAESTPGAFVTADIDDMLARDIDAVLVATYCPAHAADAIRCLRAGKHVLSEVTAFHTMAEGVRLVEEVERSGRIYNLAENYPFSAANMWLAERWRQGLFGKLVYAEYEYVHELCGLQYAYLDGSPVLPGHSVHNWRSWIDYHYYCTHSLGPVMLITGERPTRVVSLPAGNRLEGFIADDNGIGSANPSLITMSGGGLVRNLMGGLSHDSHLQRLWGTRGAAIQNGAYPLELRLGADGAGPRAEVVPRWSELGEAARAGGHGGGDFWVLHYFAQQIRGGPPSPWDIYAACDVTIPGLLAYRSAQEGGRTYDVPDFRERAQRDAWRNDAYGQERLDTEHGALGAGADPAISGRFTAVMTSLIRCARAWRAWHDWRQVAGDMARPRERLAGAETLLRLYPELRRTYREARTMMAAVGECRGRRVLGEMLDGVGGGREALRRGSEERLRREIAILLRRRN
jgi:hypothetical protein